MSIMLLNTYSHKLFIVSYNSLAFKAAQNSNLILMFKRQKRLVFILEQAYNFINYWCDMKTGADRLHNLILFCTLGGVKVWAPAKAGAWIFAPLFRSKPVWYFTDRCCKMSKAFKSEPPQMLGGRGEFHRWERIDKPFWSFSL